MVLLFFDVYYNSGIKSSRFLEANIKSLLLNRQILRGGKNNAFTTSTPINLNLPENSNQIDHDFITNFVTYIDKNGNKTKYPYFSDDPDEKVLMSGYYAFGANQMPIFINLNLVLSHLEKHHGLVIEDQEEMNQSNIIGDQDE